MPAFGPYVRFERMYWITSCFVTANDVILAMFMKRCSRIAVGALFMRIAFLCESGKIS